MEIDVHYHSNHMFCLNCNWHDGDYSCPHSVTIEKYTEWPHKTQDWLNLIVEENFDEVKEFKGRTFVTERDLPNLKPWIIEWLNQLPDIARDYFENETLKPWCIGNDDYRSRDGLVFHIFFQRRKDAMAFIKKFSVYKKPTTYCNYFNDDRRKLVDGKLVPWDD